MNAATALGAALVAAAIGIIYALFVMFGPRSDRRPAMWKYTSQLDTAGKLIDRKQYVEAEAILRPLIRERDIPGHVFHLLAISAERRGDPQEGLRMWRALTKRFPTSSAGYAGEARILIGQGQLEKAERLLEKARSQVMVVADLTKVRAQSAQARKEWPLAIELWAQVRRENPGEVAGYLEGRLCLLAVGRDEEADDLLADASMRFPSDKRVQKASQEAAGEGTPPA